MLPTITYKPKEGLAPGERCQTFETADPRIAHCAPDVFDGAREIIREEFGEGFEMDHITYPPGTSPGPEVGTWAHTAQAMASLGVGSEEGFDWDQWKDEMKEGDF